MNFFIFFIVLNQFASAKVSCWVVNVFNFSDFSPIYQYFDDVRQKKQPSSVNPDLRLNRIKSSVKLNPD